MKNFGKYILSFCFGIILLCGVILFPTSTTFADDVQYQPLSTLYPNGISHYLNLNDVEDFCVVGDDIFFVSKGKEVESGIGYIYSFIKYNFSTYEKQIIIDGNDTRNLDGTELRGFKDMHYANGVIVLKYETHIVGYETDTCRRFSIQTNSEFGDDYTYFTIADFGNNKTACASIYEKDSKHYVGVAVYDSLENLKTANYVAFGEFDLSTLSIDSDSIKEILIIGQNAYFLTSTDIYPFSITPSNSTLSLSFKEKKSQGLLARMTSANAFSYEDENYIAISTNDSISIFDKDISQNTVTTNFQNYPQNTAYVQGDKLYFYNGTDCNIKVYTITKSQDTLSLSNSTTLLMGKGSETGRFDDVCDIVMKCNEYVFVSDKGNNRIQIIYYDGSIKVLNLKENSTNYFATSLMLSPDNSLYFIKTDSIQASLCKANIFTSDEPTFDKVTDLSNTICNATITNNGKIYLLDYDSDTVQVWNTNTNSFESNITLPFTTNAFSKIEFMDTSIYVSVDKTLHKLNILNSAFKDSYEFDDDIADISIPSSDQSVYVSFTDKNHVERFSFDSGVLNDKQTSVDFDNEYKINVITVNPQDGTIYGFDENSSRIVYFNNDNFAQGYCDFESFQDDAVTSMFGYENIVKYAKIPANTFIYEYVNYKGNHDLYTEDKYVVLLDTDKSTTLFSYVLYVDGEQVKLGYVETSAIQVYEVIPSQNYALITANYNTPIYKFPTIKGGYIVNQIQNISTTVDAIATFPVSIDSTSNTYYIVKMDNNRYGFISSAYVTTNVNISQKFSANSTVKIYDYSESINVYADKEKSTIIGTLTDGQRIYVVDLDKNEELTLIQYLDEDNKIRTGYIDTKYIATDGTSPVITTAIILFVCTLVVMIGLIIWFVIFKKKQKKDLLKEKTKQSEDKATSKSTENSQNQDEENTTNKE